MRRLALLCLFTSTFLSGQTDSKTVAFNQHGWFVYTGDHHVAKRWGVHFDAQWRRHNVITQWQQFQVRPGINYAVNRKLMLTAGYAFTRLYPYGEYPVAAAFPEHRIYQQVLLRTPRENVGFSQRFRMEQRFLKYPTTADRSWTYQNRFRYMLRTEIPLVRNENKSLQWYLPIWNEVLLAIPPNIEHELSTRIVWLSASDVRSVVLAISKSVT